LFYFFFCALQPQLQNRIKKFQQKEIFKKMSKLKKFDKQLKF